MKAYHKGSQNKLKTEIADNSSSSSLGGAQVFTHSGLTPHLSSNNDVKPNPVLNSEKNQEICQEFPKLSLTGRKMIADQQSNAQSSAHNFDDDGLPLNYNKLSEEKKEIAQRKRRRHSAPRRKSDVLGKNHHYADDQLGRKLKHEPDLGIKASNASLAERKQQLFDTIEESLAKPGNDVFKDGTINWQEPGELHGNSKNGLVVSFTNDPDDLLHYFVSSYPLLHTNGTVNEKRYQEFLETKNIGLSPEEHQQLKTKKNENEQQKQSAKRALHRENEKNHALPQNVQMRLKELREIPKIKAKLKNNETITLEERNLLKRSKLRDRVINKMINKSKSSNTDNGNPSSNTDNGNTPLN